MVNKLKGRGRGGGVRALLAWSFMEELFLRLPLGFRDTDDTVYRSNIRKRNF